MSVSLGAHGFAVVSGAANPTALTTTGVTTTGGAGSAFSVYVIWFKSGGSVAPTVTDSKGNTYTQVGSTVQSTSGSFRAALFEKIGGVGGASHTFTATFGSAQNGGISIWWVEPLGSGTIARDQAPAGAYVAHNDSTPYLSNSATTTVADEILLCFAGTGTGANGETHTWNNSFTALDQEGDWNFITGSSAYRIVSATGTYQGSMTCANGATDSAFPFLVTYKSVDVAPANSMFFACGTTG